MARYNHFAESPHKKIAFKDITVGEKFRVGKYKNGRPGFIVAVKTGDSSYFEQYSKKMVRLHTINGYMVYQYEKFQTNKTE